MMQPRFPNPQNTTISALITLRELPVGQAKLAQYFEKMQPDVKIHYDPDIQKKVDFDISEKQLGVIVWENAYAAVPMRRDLFVGPWDEWWGRDRDVIRPVHIGEALIEFERAYPPAALKHLRLIPHQSTVGLKIAKVGPRSLWLQPISIWPRELTCVVIRHIQREARRCSVKPFSALDYQRQVCPCRLADAQRQEQLNATAVELGDGSFVISTDALLCALDRAFHEILQGVIVHASVGLWEPRFVVVDDVLDIDTELEPYIENE
jgi:hypothetical protein